MSDPVLGHTGGRGLYRDAQVLKTCSSGQLWGLSSTLKSTLELPTRAARHVAGASFSLMLFHFNLIKKKTNDGSIMPPYSYYNDLPVKQFLQPLN